MRTLLLILLLSFSALSQATWYESAGRATLIDNEEEIARNLAIQNALRQAMLYAGADVSSIQHLKQGLLQQEQLRVSSHGSVRDIQVIDEYQKDDYQYVTIRVDIVKELAQCAGTQHAKSLAITHFPMQQRQHATMGAIYDLTQQIPKLLQAQFNKPQSKVIADQLLTNTGEWQSYGQPRPGYTTAGSEQWLNRLTNAQYILIGEILDASPDKFDTKWFGLVDKSPQRNLVLQLRLYQRYSGTLVWQQEYRARAPWEFPVRHTVDVASHEFAQSAYGQSIERLVHRAAQDINARLACEQSRGEIVAVSSTSVTVNLGSNSNLQKGDVLQVLHQSSFTDPQGQIRQQIVIGDKQLVVDQVFPNHLVAKSMDERIDEGIQIRDWVVKQ